MSNAQVYDAAALVCLLIGLGGVLKVLSSMRQTPPDWVGSQQEFERRVQREGWWGTLSWVFLTLAARSPWPT